MAPRLRKGFLDDLRIEVNEALMRLAGDHGYEVKLEPMRHNKGVISISAKLTKFGVVQHLADDYIRRHKAVGMKLEWLGKELRLPNDEADVTYVLVGWDQTKKKMKIVLADPDGEYRYESAATINNFAEFPESSGQSVNSST